MSSNVWQASTQLRISAPRGMASQNLRTFERCYPNLPSVATFCELNRSKVALSNLFKQKEKGRIPDERVPFLLDGTVLKINVKKGNIIVLYTLLVSLVSYSHNYCRLNLY